MILSLACDTILILSQEALFCYPHHFRLLYSPQHSWGIRLFIYLFENDSLPSENSIYIFLAYAQEDGSLLISGPNSNVMCNDSNMYSINSVSEEKSVTEYDEFITYKDANDNEIIPVDRERYKSIYETDNN